MPFPRPSSPKAVWRDLRQLIGAQQRHKLLFAALAVLMPAIIIWGFVLDGRTNIMPGRQIVYAQDWPLARTDDEIKALQKVDQVKREAALRERQQAYQRLEKNLGIE